MIFCVKWGTVRGQPRKDFHENLQACYLISFNLWHTYY